MKKRICCLLTAFALTLGLLPAALAEESGDDAITVYVTISQYGEIVSDKNGDLVALVPVELSGADAYTIDDALSAAHELYYDGTDGYASSEGYYGLSLDKLWGDTSGLFGYQVNHGTVSIWDLSTAVSDGDCLDAYINESVYPDNEAYSTFDKYTADVKAGESVTLTLTEAGYDENWNTVFSACEGAAVTIDGETTGYTTDENGEVTITFDAAGTYVVSAQKYKTVDSETVTAITAPVCVVTVQWAGSGTESDPYQLATAADFDTLDELVTAGNAFAGTYFLVTADVTLNEGWDGIGRGEVGTTVSWGCTVPYTAEFIPFSGIFDGGGHTLTFPEGSQPLFDCVSGAEIRNFSVYGEYIADDGLIANYTTDSSYSATADIENVTIKSGTKITGSGFLGGYASGSNTVSIDSCTVEGGVIIGCDENGEPLGASNIGGFAGDFNGTISNSTCAATVYGDSFVGGIVGGQGQSMSETSVNDCTFTGSVIATGSYVGGISGCGYTGTGWGFSSNAACISVQNCCVTGSVSGGNYVGGILGAEPAVTQCWANGIGTVSDNVFYGTLSATETDAYIGGIIGYMKSLDRYNIIYNNYYLDTSASAGIGCVESVDTSDNYGRDDDPTGADADALTCAKSAAEMTDVSVVKLLNASETGNGHWVQGASGPEPGGEATLYALEVAGEYKTQYYIGDELNLDGIALTAVWSDGTEDVLSLSDVTVTGFDSSARAVLTLTITYQSVSAEITVAVLQASSSDSSDDDTITVSFTLLGDDKHGEPTTETGTHTLAGGGLTTWIAKTRYTVDVNATVADVLFKALDGAGLGWQGSEYVQYDSVYISGIQIPETDDYLCEMDNGSLSGWMATVNGEYLSTGISRQFLSDGDVIVFHYTDDYNAEFATDNDDNTGSSGSSGGSSGGSSSANTATAATTTTDSAAELPFADVEDHWALEAIEYVYANGLFNGTSEDEFSPELATTRGMVITVLYRLASAPETAAENAFADIAEGAWYYDAVLWGTENDIIQGYGDGLFGADDTVSREQLVTLLYRYAQSVGLVASVSGSLDGYTDSGEVSDWAEEAMLWAVSVGIINGREDGTLAPADTATRAEVAAVIMRLAALAEA